MPPRLNEQNERVREAVLVCPQALLPGELNRLKSLLPHAEFVYISAKESYGYDTNSLQVADTILAPSTLSDTAAELFERLDLRISRLDMPELFGKGGGAPVCLTNRLWGLTPQDLPDHVRWSKHPSIGAHTSL
jgi:N-dimethylarginine dimethylaminohydrolase